MNFVNVSTDLLANLLLRFCDSKTVLNLKLTSKKLNRQIPPEWCLHRLVAYEQKHLEKDHPFTEHFYLIHTCMNPIELSPKAFPILKDITLTQVEKVEQFQIHPRMTSIESVHIHNAFALEKFYIPKECVKIKAILVVCTKISEFIIHSTWEYLKILVFTRLDHLTTLTIPESCKKIEFLNVSNSNIQKIFIYPKLNHNLVIQAIGNAQLVHVYTHQENFNFILSPSLIFLKTFKCDSDYIISTTIF